MIDDAVVRKMKSGMDSSLKSWWGYPLLPYHVILLQEILTRLRSTGPSGGVAGTKERAILIIIRALFGEPTNLLLGAEPIGTLVTFARVYDVLEEELRSIHLNQRDQIVQIEPCGEPGGTSLRQLLIQHGRTKPDRRPARRS
jgi:hypothetical protein